MAVRIPPKTPTGRTSALLLALCVGLAPLPGLAQPASDAPPGDAAAGSDPQVDRAMAAYQRGTQNYNQARYEEALADFKEAASLYASADFQYNIGRCYEKLGKPDEAVRAYQTYLKAKPDANDRPNVENRIAELQQQIEREEREAEEAAAAAAAKPEPTPEPDPVPVDPEVDEPSGDSGRRMLIAGAALVGVGAAVGLGGGLGFGIAARDQSRIVDEIQTGGNPDMLTFADAEGHDADGKRFEGLQVTMVAVGSVVGVTGAVLLALGLRKRGQARAQASAWMGPARAAGISIGGRF